MNSHLKSLRQIFVFQVLVVASVALTGCSSQRKKVEVNTGVPGELSLRADRERFAQMRSNISPDERIENDELALILESMNRPDEDPQRIRDRFNTMVSRRREKFNKLMQKERENFNKSEKVRRDEFLAKLQKDRKKYSSKGKSSDENRAFYTKLDARRSEYTSEERDRRLEFDSLMREKRSNFDTHVRDVTAKFNDEHRRYSRLYTDYRRAQELKRGTEDRQRRQQWQKESVTAGDQADTSNAAGGANENGNGGYGQNDSSHTATNVNTQTNQPVRTTSPNVTDDDIKSFQNIPKGAGQPLGPADGE